MGFKDILNKLMGEDDDNLFDGVEEEEREPENTGYSSSQESRLNDYEDDYRETRRAQRAQRRSRASEDDPNKVVNIHTTAQLQVVLVKPERYEEAAAIADNLNEKRTVVLNLESTNRDIARRLLDFLSGVAYANNGQIKRVANSTYIITPYNVDVMGDLIDELENNGMFM